MGVDSSLKGNGIEEHSSSDSDRSRESAADKLSRENGENHGVRLQRLRLGSRSRFGPQPPLPLSFPLFDR